MTLSSSNRIDRFSCSPSCLGAVPRAARAGIAVALVLTPWFGACASEDTTTNDDAVGGSPSTPVTQSATANDSGAAGAPNTPPPNSTPSGSNPPSGVAPVVIPLVPGGGGQGGQPSPAVTPAGSGGDGPGPENTAGTPGVGTRDPPLGGTGGAAGSGGTLPGDTGGGGAVAGGGGSAGAIAVAGGGSGGSSTSGDGPCPTNGDPCRIIPLGDSITEGVGMDLGEGGGYRAPLFELAVNAGKNITFLGRRTEEAGPAPDIVAGEMFPKNHEGYSGFTITQMFQDVVPGWPYDGEANIILLHIGTNDIARDPGDLQGRLGTLLDLLIEGNPNALIVVAQLIPLSFGSVESYNSSIPDVLQPRIDAGEQIIMVDQFTGFPTSELGDGVHPNEAGYGRMAGVWFEAIEPYLP